MKDEGTMSEAWECWFGGESERSRYPGHIGDIAAAERFAVDRTPSPRDGASVFVWVRRVGDTRQPIRVRVTFRVRVEATGQEESLTERAEPATLR